MSNTSLKHNTVAYFLTWLIFFSACIVTLGGLLAPSLGLALGLSIVFALLALVAVNVPALLRPFAIIAYIALALCVGLVVLAYGINLRKVGTLEGHTIRAIVQTDWFEAFHYLRLSLTWSTVAMVVPAIILAIYAFPQPRTLASPVPKKWLTLSVPLGLSLLLVGLCGKVIASPILETLTDYRDEIKSFEEALAKRQINPPDATTTNFDGRVIVVIGESTSRRHLGLYGYFRDTTPLLNARQEELLLFSDVVSPHSHTVPVLTSALTLAGTREDLSFESADAIDIVTLAKAAGYHTTWLSSHNEFGLYDTPITLLAETADDVRFFNPTFGTDYRRFLFDQAMLPAIEEALEEEAGSPKAIFVHLFATHFPYCQAYPETFNKYQEPLGPAVFGKAKPRPLVNCYDNAVGYLDWLLDSIIAMAESSDEPTSVIYFSDHGEAPLLGTYHEARLHSAYHIEVPFFFWFNAPFLERYPEVVRTADANKDRPYSLSRLFHTLGDLLQIQSQALDFDHSLLNRHLVDQERILFDGERNYDAWSDNNDYRENSRVFLNELGDMRSKVWAHRINSLGAILEAKEIFDGLELDVVFDSADNRFHVFHPPAEDTGLTLDRMLEAIEDRPAMRLWVDWKNASPANLDKALERLEALDRRFGLKSRLLLETDSNALFSEVSEISRSGYLHGYYLPTQAILQCLSDCSDDQQAVLAQSIKERVEQGGFGAVTYDWRLKPFVRTWLADFIEQENLKEFSWDLTTNTAQGLESAEKVRESAKTLNGLLVVFPSVFRI